MTDRSIYVDIALLIKSLVDGRYEVVEKIVSVMDNVNTQSATSLYETFELAEVKRSGRLFKDPSHVRARQMIEHGGESTNPKTSPGSPKR